MICSKGVATVTRCVFFCINATVLLDIVIIVYTQVTSVYRNLVTKLRENLTARLNVWKQKYEVDTVN